MASLRMSEGVGVVNSTVFIELEGAAQPPLMVDLQMTTFDGANRKRASLPYKPVDVRGIIFREFQLRCMFNIQAC